MFADQAHQGNQADLAEQAQGRAADAGNGVNVAYIIPKEGACLWFETLAIPGGATHVENAHAFINYLMQPEVMAGITNYVWHPNAVPASKPLIDKEITSDPSIYPPEAVAAKLFTFPVYTPRADRIGSRMWTALKAGR